MEKVHKTNLIFKMWTNCKMLETAWNGIDQRVMDGGAVDECMLAC